MKKNLFTKLAVCASALLLLTVSPVWATDDCNGGPECYASGNFKINTFAAGGGYDYDGKLGPNAAAGGVSAAGGIAAGAAEGGFETIEIPIYEKRYLGNLYGWGKWNPDNYAWTRVGTEYIPLGSAEASLNQVAGGGTITEKYVFHPTGRNSFGIGSQSTSFATSTTQMELGALGLAVSKGCFIGAAGQATLDGSIVGPAVNRPWDSKGFSAGVAGQGSVGAYVGGGLVAGAGRTFVEGGIESMEGFTLSESYRILDGNTEIMGTNVYANTIVVTDKYVETQGIGVGGIEGGFVAGGIAASKTVQTLPSGIAVAKATGTYIGGGELNCDLNMTAVGGTRTSATKIGTNGSIMSSSAAMKVSSKR